MKKAIVTLAFMLIAPLAFAQTSSTHKRQATATTEPISVTGTIIQCLRKALPPPRHPAVAYLFLVRLALADEHHHDYAFRERCSSRPIK